MRKDSSNPLDVHQSVTNSIVAAIEAGAENARLPWHRTGASSILPKNVATGNAYNGINVLALWATAQEPAYTHSLWGTYKQFQSLDAQVRKARRPRSSSFTSNTTSSPIRSKITTTVAAA
jgi:antirestriction protein ArdC